MSKEEDEATKKRMKLDQSSSSSSSSSPSPSPGSPPNVKPEEQGCLSPPMENKPRTRDDKDVPSGSAPSSSTHQDRKSKSKTKSSSSSFLSSCRLVYKNFLTDSDVNSSRLTVALENGIKFLPVPQKREGSYAMSEITAIDQEGRIWDLKAEFDETSSSYIFTSTWDKYVKKYDLKAGDTIMIFDDPAIKQYLFIRFERMVGELVFRKILTHTDINYCRLTIPLELGEKFLPQPMKWDGRYDMAAIRLADHEGRFWEMQAAYDEKTSSYMFFLNWDKYVKRYDLKPGDVLLLYDDPNVMFFFIRIERLNQS